MCSDSLHRGDGRYVVSNGKDQTCKLWDLRKMVSSERFDTMTPKYCGSPSFDYRSGVVPKPRYSKHPHDQSVMTFSGHTVLSTLIRCHFSPAEQNGQRYVYSGSADVCLAPHGNADPSGPSSHLVTRRLDPRGPRSAPDSAVRQCRDGQAQ